MQAKMYERLKTLNLLSGREARPKAEIVWCNPFSAEKRFLREEERFSKEPKIENEKFFKKWDSCHIRACVRVRKQKMDKIDSFRVCMML